MDEGRRAHVRLLVRASPMTDLMTNKSVRAAFQSRDAGALASGLGAERAEDSAELLNRMKPAFAADVLQALPEAASAEILDQPQLGRQAAILSALPPEKAARLIELMSADRAAHGLRDMRISVRNELLGKVSAETRAALEKLLPYSGDCAGHIMTTEFVAAPAEWTVGEVMAHIRSVENTRETIYAIYILEPGTGALLRAISLRELVLADPNVNVLAAAPARPPMTVTPETPLDETVRLISKYNLLAIPVVDAERRPVGIVTVDDAVDTLVQRQDSEMQRFGGMEALDAPYMHIGFPAMIKKRAGWLCALFLAEMLTASAMQTYEAELEKAVVLALFIPLVMSSGGNSGAQASSLIIRALALKDVRLGDWWRVMLRELPSGLALGAILGVIGALRITIWQVLGIFDYGPHWKLIALTIALALVGIVTFGSLAGSILPFVAKRLGFDPATASSPFVATLVDVTGIVIYFSVAILILRGTLL
jgi:magnesium transporter